MAVEEDGTIVSLRLNVGLCLFSVLWSSGAVALVLGEGNSGWLDSVRLRDEDCDRGLSCEELEPLDHIISKAESAGVKEGP